MKVEDEQTELDLDELERILQTPTKNWRGSMLISKKQDFKQESGKIQPSSDQHLSNKDQEMPIWNEIFLCTP